MEEIVSQVYKVPEIITQKIDDLLKSEGTGIHESKTLANAVKWQSDFFIQNPMAATPWHDSRSRIAYASYYFVLNYLRNLKAVDHLLDLSKKKSWGNIVEFGCGNGAFLQAFESRSLEFFRYNGLEISKDAIAQNLALNPRVPRNIFFNEELMDEVDLAVFSYSFTEISELPEWIYKAKNILLVEPSTHQDARRLMKLRPRFLEKGFEILGPCTHSLDCPLIKNSKKDWCHDRLQAELPSWFKKLQNHLAFKKNSPAFSYLLLTQDGLKHSYQGSYRVIGDFKRERGKTRQMVCGGEQREFLSFVGKKTEPVAFSRGDLVRFSEDTPKKSNEIRPEPGQFKKIN
ncbi:MAG: small ribosomal subunit Rsm22 family protein [Bdellovibrionales bacterium]